MNLNNLKCFIFFEFKQKRHLKPALVLLNTINQSLFSAFFRKPVIRNLFILEILKTYLHLKSKKILILTKFLSHRGILHKKHIGLRK
jgi:hypothetical protein